MTIIRHAHETKAGKPVFPQRSHGLAESLRWFAQVLRSACGFAPNNPHPTTWTKPAVHMSLMSKCDKAHVLRNGV